MNEIEFNEDNDINSLSMVHGAKWQNNWLVEHQSRHVNVINSSTIDLGS